MIPYQFEPSINIKDKSPNFVSCVREGLFNVWPHEIGSAPVTPLESLNSVLRSFSFQC